MDPALKNLFDTAGITSQQLQDKETSKFIYEFLEQHGGVDSVADPAPLSMAPPPPVHAPMGEVSFSLL